MTQIPNQVSEASSAGQPPSKAPSW